MKIKAFISIYAVALLTGSASFAAPMPLGDDVPSFAACVTPECLSSTSIKTEAPQQDLAAAAKKAKKSAGAAISKTNKKSAAAASAKKAKKSARVATAKKTGNG